MISCADNVCTSVTATPDIVTLNNGPPEWLAFLGAGLLVIVAVVAVFCIIDAIIKFIRMSNETTETKKC